MGQLVRNVLIGGVFGVVVGLACGGGPAYFLMGLVLALALAVMLFFGSYATRRPPTLDPRRFAVAGVVALVMGWAFFLVMDSEPVWWSVGVILAGSFMSAVPPARTESKAGQSSRD